MTFDDDCQSILYLEIVCHCHCIGKGSSMIPERNSSRHKSASQTLSSVSETSSSAS